MLRIVMGHNRVWCKDLIYQYIYVTGAFFVVDNVDYVDDAHTFRTIYIWWIHSKRCRSDVICKQVLMPFLRKMCKILCKCYNIVCQLIARFTINDSDNILKIFHMIYNVCIIPISIFHFTLLKSTLCLYFRMHLLLQTQPRFRVRGFTIRPRPWGHAHWFWCPNTTSISPRSHQDQGNWSVAWSQIL